MDLVCDLVWRWCVEPDGDLSTEWLNRTEFLGYDATGLAGTKAWLQPVHADDRVVAEDALAQVFANQDAIVEFRVRSNSGQSHWLRLYLRPEWDPALRRVVRVHGAAQDITAAKRSEIEKSALLDVSRQIGGLTNVDELLNRVHRQMAHALRCEIVVTFRWDDDRQAFHAVAQHGAPSEHGAELLQLNIAPEAFDASPRHSQAVVHNDPAGQAWLPAALCERLHITALLVVPLQVRGRRFGTILGLTTTDDGGFDEAQAELADAMARQLAVALEGAELFAAQEEQAVVSGALARIGRGLIASLDRPASLQRFCAVVTDTLGCDVAQTWLWHPTEDAFFLAAAHGYDAEELAQLTTLRLPRSLSDQWIPSGHDAGFAHVVTLDHPSDPIRSAAFGFGVTALICMRLNSGSTEIGVQCAGYRNRHDAFTTVQRRIAEGIAQVASMALSHARLVDELARANRLKSDFVATMSHELRTPLNTLMGYTDLLSSGEFGPVTEEQLNVLGRMDHSARELLDLINATLDLSRIETRRMPIEIGNVTLLDLLLELEGETRYQRQQRQIALDWEITPEATRIRSDRTKLKVILKNLLANAVKFTEQGGVTVAVAARDGGCEFTIRDTGVGIAPEVLPIIFEPFRQGEGAMTRRYGGVGLGLYVVRRLLDLLEGTISVESKVGAGTTCRVWVPSAAEAEIGLRNPDTLP